MKASEDFITQLENLYQSYEQEVRMRATEGTLAENTEKTYLLHSNNFVRWCRNDFVPGGSKKSFEN